MPPKILNISFAVDADQVIRYINQENLRFLNISHSKLNDLSQIANFTNLCALNVNDNKVSFISISDLDYFYRFGIVQ
jgi:hypothetical protein